VKQELPEYACNGKDFATPHGPADPAHYQDQLLTFNDDIQGTSAVVLGATLAR